MFFDPDDYLERKPGAAESKAETARLMRAARQRASLCEAMTRVAAKRGLEGATIDAAVQTAGLSRGTFYRLYETREACVLEAFERCADTLLGHVAEAVDRGSGDPLGGARAGLAALRELLGGHSEVARMLLVEIRAGDVRCREAQQRWLGRFAGLLACERGSEQAPQRGSVAWLATGALASVLALDLEDPDGGQGGATLEEMAEVAMWPRRGAAVEVPVEIDGTADGGADEWVEAERERRGAARRRRARRIERERILAAMADSVEAKGYRATQLGDVLEPADVSPFVFYTHFSGKEECMLAAFDAAVASILEQVRPATASATGCAAKAEAALRGLTELLAARETTARLVTVEVRAVGAKGEERLEEALGGVRELIGGGAEQEQTDAAAEVAATVARVAAGMIAREVGEGRASELPDLLPELVFVVLAPYLGGEEAAWEMRRCRDGLRNTGANP